MKMYATENSKLESLSEVMVYNHYCQSNNDNNDKIQKMKKHLYKAFKVELTPKQSYCITEYYINNRKMVDIAKDMGITPSVVSRHISRGIKKLKRTLPYFEF
ncbi:MAG: sigma-70 family RNA polymerase sigma factor [Acutalibacteraceae bacterium]|nr:sigma-70 family RNA polymerase sigma factor [Acutalibacteraceae bacterium]